jgi:hypothetical protein
MKNCKLLSKVDLKYRKNMKILDSRYSKLIVKKNKNFYKYYLFLLINNRIHTHKINHKAYKNTYYMETYDRSHL